jgi:hypothetical protein
MADRVIPTARARGASYYDPPNAQPDQWIQNDVDWLNTKMDEGCRILDCGAAPGRANFPNATSPYYQRGLDEIAKLRGTILFTANSEFRRPVSSHGFEN